MRKLIAMLLVLMVLLGTAAGMDTHKVHALSNTSIVATTDKASYYVGDTVKVMITGQNILDLNGVGFTLNYDASLLNLQGSGIVLSPSYESFGGAIVDTTNGALTYDILNKAPVSYTKTEPIGQINFKVLKSGIGTIRLSGIIAVDSNLLQVQSSTQTQTAFSVDVQLPAPTMSANITTPTNTDVTVTISYPSEAVVKEYKVGDSGAWTTYTAPVSVSDNATVYARGTDAAGKASNVTSITVSNIYKIAPVTSAILSPAVPNGENGWYKTDVLVSLTAVANEAGGVVTTEYQVNDGAWITYTGSIPAFGDGTHKLGYRSKDQAGNEEALKTVEFKVDKKAPTQSSPSNPTSNTPPTTPKPTTIQIVKQNDLPAAVKGKITIQMEEGKNTILLPSRLTDLIGVNSLQIVQKDFTIEIPKEALKNMQGALAGKQVDGAQLSFSAIIASQDGVTKLVNDAINGSTRIVTASQVYDFSLHVVTTDGTRIPITTFEEPLVLSFQVNPNADSHLLGMYYIASDGTIQYMGGTLVNGSMTAKLTHFSPYAVLVYDKTFSDVASSLWSSRVIKEMAAKHIIEGVTDTEFNPGGNVTRAQFAALLARALGLKAVGSAHFKDVNPGDWHEQVIAAVSEAGIVLGRSSDTFAPDDAITREEMAVMAVRAYEHVKGEQVTLSNTNSFSDQAQVHEWAQNAVRAAQEVGLIQGRSSNQFAPQALMTRAESAQVIANLLND
ncbi:S-layer homology domain-containing protein [Paenibacillus sp. Soil750]|uniref:S-layer homology domain-containing protein n=1 Tax=Paenibacillus sp. Soil750 TaxID=1736398 RepID=UPI0006F7D00E|nr:S-layer homology domain-containing protein [Paenibacillus sp. Soil750]KRE63319.1 hypothetical protein ASL11_23485 [Paenibacillus sp. Soil750]